MSMTVLTEKGTGHLSPWRKPNTFKVSSYLRGTGKGGDIEVTKPVLGEKRQIGGGGGHTKGKTLNGDIFVQTETILHEFIIDNDSQGVSGGTTEE